jgi:MFS superfamily sulfate permease-like transporter
MLVRKYSRKHGYKADGNQVLFAYGITNVTVAFTGGLVSGNSPSRSASMEASGSGSQLPSLVAAATVALVMLLFTDMLAFLPNAALAGIVANAVLSLIEVKELRELWHIRRTDFWIAIVCLTSVFVLGPLKAVIIAFLMASIDVVRRASKPDTWVLREAPDGSHLIPEEEAEDDTGAPGLLVYRFGASLYFANANLFMEEVERLVTDREEPVQWFVLDAEAVADVDSTGAEALHEALKLLANRGVTVAVSRANKPFIKWLKNYDLFEAIGDDRFYPTNRHALAAYREQHPGTTPKSSEGRES